MIVRKRVMIALVGSVAVVMACSGRMDAQTTTCMPYVPITIDLRPGEMRVYPKDVCREPGKEILLRIIPPGEPDGTVRTVADRGNPDGGGPRNWLSQSNRGDRIEVRVPSDAAIREMCPGFPETTCDFDYEVQADGKGPLDPRVTVRR